MIPAVRTFICLLFLSTLFSNHVLAQGSSRRPIKLLREIDLEEGKQRLDAFRRMWVVGDFSVQYLLQYIPRRGKRQEVKGTLWSTNSPIGPVSLIHIHSDPGSQLYLKNGPLATVSRRSDSGESWKEVGIKDWFTTVDSAVTLTPFDLMMPFVYWEDWSYEGVTKIRGRVAHAFLMKAPESVKGNPWNLSGVVVFLDEDFNALLKAQYISENETILKSFRLLDLKKVEGVWLPKTVDFLDETTRNKTRLVIKEAAVNQNFRNHALGNSEIPESVPEIPLSNYVEVR